MHTALAGCFILLCASCEKGPPPFTDFPPLFNLERTELLKTLGYDPPPEPVQTGPKDRVSCYVEGIEFHGYQIRASFSRFSPYGKPYSLVVNFPSDFAPEPEQAIEMIHRIHGGRILQLGEQEDFNLPGLRGIRYPRGKGTSVLGNTSRVEVIFKRINVSSLPLSSSLSFRQMGY